MPIRIAVFFILCLGCVGLRADDGPEYRHVRLQYGLPAEVPEALVSPEGRTRWDLSGLSLPRSTTRTLTVAVDGSGVEVVEGGVVTRFRDPAGGPDARRWLLPDGDPSFAEPGVVFDLRLEELRGETIDELWIQTRRVGIGWVHLPSGPREVVLQRALVLRASADSHGFEPESLVHRWIDPRAGVVAEVRGPASADGWNRLGLERVTLVDEVLAGATAHQIYVDELFQPTFRDILYGWDKGSGTTVASLTPEGYANIGELIDADSWDFSGNTTGTEAASTVVPLDATHTCNIARCGYDRGVGELGRRDLDFDGASPVISNQVTERIDDPGTGEPTIFLRSGAQKEGATGAFGAGESGFCYVDGYCNGDFMVACATDPDCNAVGGPCIQRTEVPLWKFPTQDAQGWFMQPGDSWQSGVFQCEQSLNNRSCGGLACAFPFLCPPDLWAGTDPGCTDSFARGYAGTQSSEVVKGGVVTLPSGHTLNALVVRNKAEFCVYDDPPCDQLNDLSRVRTIIYIWQVPHLGSVVLLQSVQNVECESDTEDPNRCFGDANEPLEQTFINFGLFPPISIQADDVRDEEVDLSWDPGNDTHRIRDYVVYWDTESAGGADEVYAFDSLNNPGQVAFSGTSATISGLVPETTYYFTVTSRSDYTDPVSSITTTYESIRYPTTVSGDPNFVYPLEVQATTPCTLPEALGLTVDKSNPSDIEVCWERIGTPCLAGYRIQAASNAESDANYSPVVPDPDSADNCSDGSGRAVWVGDPMAAGQPCAGSDICFMLAIGRSSTGEGLWGHYGR